IRKGSYQITVVIPLRGPDFYPCRCFSFVDSQAIDEVAVGEIGVGIIILAIVARGMDKEYVVFYGKPNGIINDLLIFCECFTKAHVNYLGAVFYCITNGVGYIFIALVAIGYGPQYHNTYIVGYTFDANIVITHSANDARYVRAVIGIRSGDIGVAIIALATVFVIITYNMPRIKFFVEVIVYLIVKMLKIGRAHV